MVPLADNESDSDAAPVKGKAKAKAQKPDHLRELALEIEDAIENLEQDEEKQSCCSWKCSGVTIAVLVVVITIRILCAGSEYQAYKAHFEAAYRTPKPGNENDIIIERDEIYTTEIGMLEVVWTQGIENAMTVIVISPGNPGIAAIWIPFLKNLKEMSCGDVQGIVGGYYGHGVPDPKLKSQSWFSLQDQIDSREHFIGHIMDDQKPKYAWIQRFISEDGKNLVLAGHSLGNYTNLMAISQGMDVSKFTQIQLWCPTITDIAKSEKGQELFMRCLSWVQYLTPIGTGLIRYLTPRSFARKFLSGKDKHSGAMHFESMSQSLSYVIRDSRTQFLMNYAGLYVEEAAQIKAVQGRTFPAGIERTLEDHGKNIRVLWTMADHWAAGLEAIHAAVCPACLENVAVTAKKVPGEHWKGCARFHVFPKPKKDASETPKLIPNFVPHDFVSDPLRKNGKGEPGKPTHGKVIRAIQYLLGDGAERPDDSDEQYTRHYPQYKPAGSA